MDLFKYRVLELRNSQPREWMKSWASRYSSEQDGRYDEEEYDELIKKHDSFTAGDFIRIGQWKDYASSKNRWKENVASVAFLIWQQVAAELPRCPKEAGIAAFLQEWSDRAYTDTYSNGTQRHKHFGLSRASTMLHFVSGGQYPIFDSRVRTAFVRLLGEPEFADDVPTYLEKVLPSFKELARQCECDSTEYRKLDKALFSYGAFNDPVIKL